MEEVRAGEKGTVDDLPPNKPSEYWDLAASCFTAATFPSYLVGRPCILVSLLDESGVRQRTPLFLASFGCHEDAIVKPYHLHGVGLK